MHTRTVLAIGAILLLIALFMIPTAGGQQKQAKPEIDQVQRYPDADHPYTPLFDHAGPVTSDPDLKAGVVPIPAEYDIVRDVAFPARAGTGGGDIPEAEPNDTPSYANAAKDFPFNCSGTIDHVGDIDWIRMFVTTGEPLQINAHSRVGLLMSPLDPLLMVYRDDGTIITWNDDISWPSNRNAQVNFTTSYTGDIFIAVRSAVMAGSPDHRYIVEVWPTMVPIFDGANVETEPNDMLALADPINLPGAKVGMIGVSGDVDLSYFDAPAGATVVVDVHSQIYALPLDAVVRILAWDGTQLFICDDMDGRDPRFNLVLPYTGRYYMQVTDFANTGSGFHVYVLSVSLQDGTQSPHISNLKFNGAGLLKKVVGYNFDPTAEGVEIGGIFVPIVPSLVKPYTVIKVKPPVHANAAVTVLVGNGRRSNPAFPSPM